VLDMGGRRAFGDDQHLADLAVSEPLPDQPTSRSRALSGASSRPVRTRAGFNPRML
jgi:hypothetical protein